MRWHRALELLARTRPEAASRARAALDVLLDGCRAFSSSTLTSDRYPCELAVGGDGRVRYTVEVAAPSPAARLDVSLARLAQLGAPSLDGRLHARLQSIARSPRGYGAWVGGRHTQQSDDYKLYIEVSRDGRFQAERFARELLGTWGAHRRHPLSMIGVELSRSIIELYFRVEGSWPSDFGLAQVAAQANDALELRDAWRAPRACGFSTAVTLERDVVATSLFGFAHQLVGADAEVRARLLAFARARNWDFADYEAITAPLARGAERGLHGMLALISTGAPPTALRVGLSPPVEARA